MRANGRFNFVQCTQRALKDLSQRTDRPFTKHSQSAVLEHSDLDTSNRLIIWQSTIIEFSEVPKHDNGRLIGDTRCWKLNLPFAFMTVLYITFPEYIKHDNLDLAR